VSFALTSLHTRFNKNNGDGQHLAMAQQILGRGKEREAPPVLFLAPPSQNASHVSLPGILQTGANLVPPNVTSSSSTTATQRVPLSRQASNRAAAQSNIDQTGVTTLGNVLPRPALQRQRIPSEGQKQADRTDALWAQMQNTLEDVEMTAERGTHVFGAEHTRALEELRKAQIALAQAWAKSEADDGTENAEKETRAPRGSGIGSEGKSMLDSTEGGISGHSGTGAPGSSGGVGKVGSKLEEETEADILLARRRREANDNYFKRVNEGVEDVVKKLEDVAKAMAAVEKQNRETWDDSEQSLDKSDGDSSI
jgi:hypothetical protein